jgi:hypothetical protein
VIKGWRGQLATRSTSLPGRPPCCSAWNAWRPRPEQEQRPTPRPKERRSSPWTPPAAAEELPYDQVRLRRNAVARIAVERADLVVAVVRADPAGLDDFSRGWQAFQDLGVGR